MPAAIPNMWRVQIRKRPVFTQRVRQFKSAHELGTRKPSSDRQRELAGQALGAPVEGDRTLQLSPHHAVHYAAADTLDGGLLHRRSAALLPVKRQAIAFEGPAQA